MGVAVQEFFARFSPPSRAARAIGASMLCVCLSAGRSAAQVPLASADVRLQSEGAGGGTLAVRLTYPASVTNYRYPDGAPVAVYLAGGFTPGGLGGSPRIPQQGFVLVTFIYPGGSEGATASDGIYDYRGDNCQKALRDMIRFAGGVATDTLGRLIDDVVPGPVHPGLVGLAPFSNGLIGLITLDRYGAEIPFTPYHVGWENPTSGQIVAVELGGIRDDCDPATDSDGNGIPGDDGRNPWYDPANGIRSVLVRGGLRRARLRPPIPRAIHRPDRSLRGGQPGGCGVPRRADERQGGLHARGFRLPRLRRRRHDRGVGGLQTGRNRDIHRRLRDRDLPFSRDHPRVERAERFSRRLAVVDRYRRRIRRVLGPPRCYCAWTASRCASRGSRR